MKKKRGRPKLASGQAKAQFINLRFSPAEARQIDTAAERAKQKRAKWARNALLSAAKNRDTKSSVKKFLTITV